MLDTRGRLLFAEKPRKSNAFERFARRFSCRAVGVLSGPAGVRVVVTHPSDRAAAEVPVFWAATGPRGDRPTVRLGDGLAGDLERICGGPAGLVWRACRLQDEGGGVDHLAFARSPDSDDALPDGLGLMWNALRAEIDLEVEFGAAAGGEASALWSILDDIRQAILILDRDGRLRRANSAGEKLLADGDMLCLAAGRVSSALHSGRDPFRAVVKACADGEPGASDRRAVLLTHAGTGIQVPVTVSRYRQGRASTPSVVVTIPVPPDPAGIEALATQMGLTPAEAKVASLMQAGMTNRQAAVLAGVTEQTFNTYAKRVLAKLNTGCRTELAGLLTWLAAGARLT